MSEDYTKAPRAAVNVNAEDVATILRAVPVSPGVRWQRERENETAALAIQIDREHKRRKKGDGRAADEALARAEAIVAAAESKTRMVTTNETGRRVPLSALRETALKRLEIEFGADMPIHVECAHCHEVFFVKAGTPAREIPKTCKRGCRCANGCARRTSRKAALLAVKERRRANCGECARRLSATSVRRIDATRKALRNRSSEQTSAALAKANAAIKPGQRAANLAKITPEQRHAAGVRLSASLTTEQRAASLTKARAARHAKASQKTQCANGHELAIVGKKPDGSCRACASETNLRRRIAKGQPLTPAPRSEVNRKAWATRRANAAAKGSS